MSGEGNLVERVVPDVVRQRFVRKYFGIVVAAMVLTAGVGVALGVGTTATLDDRVDRQVSSTAELQADGLEGWIDGLRHQTRTISEAAPFQTGRSDEISAYLLNRLDDERADIVAIHYVKISNATVIESTVPGMAGTRLTGGDAPWAERAATIDNETDAVSNVLVADRSYRSAANGTVVAFISAPPGNTEHVVVVEAALSSRGEFQQTTESAFTTVRHDTGEMVYGQAHADAALPAAARATDASGVAALSSTVVGYAPVEGTDWTVATHVPKGDAYALKNQMERLIGGLILVPLLVLGAATAVFGRRTGRALERLTGKAEQIADGDLDVTFDRQRADEIGQLTEAFGSMQSSLREEIADAKRARTEAEVARTEAVEMNDYLQEQAEEYSETLSRCAAGDLTVRMEPDGHNESMDRIATDFNEMLAELEKTTSQLKQFATVVADTGESVESSAYSLQEAAEQIAESVQRVAIDTDDQRERLETVADELDATARALETYDDETDVDLSGPLANIETAASTLSTAATVTDETAAETETVAGASEEQAAELISVSQQAEKLQRYAAPLGEVLGRFKTDAEREFYFPSGPGNRSETPPNDE